MSSHDQLISQIKAEMSSSSSLQSDQDYAAESIISTLKTLLQVSESNLLSDNIFNASKLSVVRKGSSEPPEAVKELVLAAQKKAPTLLRSSVLTGSSEGDEYGDVGVWLGEGEYGKGQEKNVLEPLGMSDWLNGNVSAIA